MWESSIDPTLTGCRSERVSVEEGISGKGRRVDELVRLRDGETVRIRKRRWWEEEKEKSEEKKVRILNFGRLPTRANLRNDDDSLRRRAQRSRRDPLDRPPL